MKMWRDWFKLVSAFLFVTTLLLIGKIGNYFIQICRRLLNLSLRVIGRPQGNTEFIIFPELAKSYGYAAETHSVTTEDDYILTIHRLPGKSQLTAKNSKGKPAVLFVHGIVCASDVWIVRGPGKDLAFLLVDAGYDVWLLNERGNFYSKGHKTLSAKSDSKFWKFSFHEIGIYDLPATVDYILDRTGQEKLAIVGQSMGCLNAFIFLSSKPEYNEKIRINFALAPCSIFTRKIPGPLHRFFADHGNQIKKVLSIFGIDEIFPRNRILELIHPLVSIVPWLDAPCQKLGLNVMGMLVKPECNIVDPMVMRKILHHYPQGSALRSYLHYRQILLTGEFKPFDCGPQVNETKYGSPSPPEYPLHKISVFTPIYYGVNDGLSQEDDAQTLLKKLPNTKAKAIEDPLFCHLDFIFGAGAKERLYDDIVSVMNDHHENCDSKLAPA